MEQYLCVALPVVSCSHSMPAPRQNCTSPLSMVAPFELADRKSKRSGPIALMGKSRLNRLERVMNSSMSDE